MLQWNFWDNGIDDKQWDDLVGRFDDANIFQSAGWGNLKGTVGWKPVRWLATSGQGEPVFAAQILEKRRLGMTLLWLSGGPLLRPKVASPKELSEAVAEFAGHVASRYGVSFLRLNSLLPHDSGLSARLAPVFERPLARMLSGYSVWHDLTKDNVPQIQSKHRYYVKHAQKANLEWRWLDAAEGRAQFWSLLGGVESAKGSFRHGVSQTEMERLPEFLGDRARFLGGFIDGKLATGCLILHFAGHAYYYLAGTNEVGRKVSAAYAMVPELWRRLSELGMTDLDFGGIAPANPGAAGVDHFKKGFGGNIVEYLGEWEVSHPRAGRFLFNPMLARRAGGRPAKRPDRQ